MRALVQLRSALTLAIATAVTLAYGQDHTAAPVPLTPKRPVVDKHHGVQVTDDYRWLENWNDPEVKAWSDAQNAHARALLDKLPFREEIRARLTDLEMKASVAYFALVRRGDRLFALKSQPPKPQPLLVILKSADDTAGEQVLVDPGIIDATGGTTIDWYVPTRDGKRVAVSMSSGGTESGTVHIYDVSTGKETGDVIPRAHGGTAGGSLAWVADNSGCFYTRYPRGNERASEDMDFYQQVYFHKLGTKTEEDEYVLGKEFPRIAEIQLDASENGEFILVTTENGDGGEFRFDLLCRVPVNDLAAFPFVAVPLAGFERKLLHGEFGAQGFLYLLSRDGAPRGQIVRVKLPVLDKRDVSILDIMKTAESIVPEGDAVIQDFEPTPGRLYVLDIVGGPSQLRVFDPAGKALKPVDLPPVSSVHGLVPLDGDDILYNVQTYLSPPAWFQYSAATSASRRTALFATSPVDGSAYEVVRENATSKDGTQIPVNIIRKKGLQLGGQNPTVVWGYGGFGASETPSFSPRRMVWVEQGGVFAIANIRGGSEFGEQWHRAGNLTNKQNCFDDFCAACQHMIDAGYTRREKLAIFGGSNGGLLMGGTFTQHPDLCHAVVSTVGIYDMLRVELSSNGAFNVTEYGTVKDPEQFKALYAYSPYQHVRDGTKYPAILFMTGANDPRVDPMQSRKMVARLQAADPSGTFLLRTSANTGHVGSSLKDRIEQSVDIYGFLFAELDVPYQAIQTATEQAPPS